MEITVFKVVETSYRFGDDETPSETLFATKELMDEYFDILYSQYKSNKNRYEEDKEDDEFWFNDGGKWTYKVHKEVSKMDIKEKLINV